MKEIKTIGENKIFEKKSGRYAVKGADKKYINGDAKAKILAEAGLVAIPEPKAAPVEEESEENTVENAESGEESATEE